MYFKTLPKHIQDAILALTTDDEFQKRFGTDHILNELDEQKFNRPEQLRIFKLLLNGKITIFDVEVKGITPAMWSYLWIIDSPFVTGTKQEPSAVDIDIFMYTLMNDCEEYDPVATVTNSLAYCSKNGIDYNKAIEIILTSIKLAFKPLNMFPRVHSVGNHLLYDSDWLTSTVARVNTVTGYSPEKIMKQLPLTAVCYYFAQYARINGNDGIYKRTPDQLLIAQDERCCQLIVDRLVEKQVIPECDRNKFLKEIMYMPDVK